MNSLDEQYGYDANFISDVLDYLKCNVCHLVMRQPVQIMTCGHRFCKPCFERLQGYSTYLNTQFCCPIDREPIDINKDHEKECQHQINQNVGNQTKLANTENTRLVAELIKRVQSCENTMNGKEKELAHIKYDIREIEKKYGEKEKEVATLKTINKEIRQEMDETKKINEKLKEYFKNEFNTLEKRNEKLETRLISLETQVKEDTKIIPEHLKLLETQIKANENFKADTTNKIKLLEIKVETNETTIKEYKDKSASKRQLESFKIKGEEITGQQTSFSDNAEALTSISDHFSIFKTRLESMEKLHTTFQENIVHHLENIENVIFCHEPYCKEKNVKIKWVLTNFQRNYNLGEDVYSPKFYTSLQGYCFKLCVDWTGDDKQDLGLFLYICLNEHIPVEKDEEGKYALDPFRIEYDLEIHHKDGGSEVHSVTFADLDENRYDCFTLRPGVNEVGIGYGKCTILHKSTWNEYLINDRMFITCTFRIC